MTLPPAVRFPVLEKLSLSGYIVNLGSLLNHCHRLQVLSVTQRDTHLLRITSGEFPVLEKLSLSGNIADLGTLLNRCPRLRVLNVTFHGVALSSLEAALTTLEEATQLGLVLSLLGIMIPWRDGVDATCLASLIRTAVRLSPRELVFGDHFAGCTSSKHISVDLPCFPHATSIEMSLQDVCFTTLSVGEFSALERLSLTGLRGILDIGALVNRCPRLRELKATVATANITIHSASLKELDVFTKDGHTECHGIDIVTPVLKQVHLNIRASRHISVSISAPAVENVSWERVYTDAALVFGSWQLQSMSVQTIDNRDDTCLQAQQPPSFHVLFLRLHAGNYLDAELNFTQEIEKLPITNFFVLKLTFESDWHVYGALVLQLLRMRRICAATKKLKVVLPWWPKAKRACVRNCPCDKPRNWRCQSIFRTNLDQVDIHGFNGEDHEHDFIRLIFKCSPMLRTVIVRPSETFRGHSTELSDIRLAHPSVKCYW